MALKEKASELRQARAKLLDEARELTERSEKENRTMNADEQNRFDAILGGESAAGKIAGEANALAQRISQIERTIAVDSFPEDHETRRRGVDLPLPHEDESNVGTRFQYSLIKAIRQMASKGQEPLDGLELEVSKTLAERSHKVAQGVMVPYRTSGPKGWQAESRFRDGRFREKRALDTSAGAGTIPTILSKDWIELLRHNMAVMAAGASEILDLQGKFSIPRQTGASTGYWLSEAGTTTLSNQTFDQVAFTPKTVGAATDITRRFFELTNATSAEEMVKADLTAVIARAIDLAALNGSGNSGQPLGIMQNTAITGATSHTYSYGTNGGAPTWTGLVALHTAVTRSDASTLGVGAYMSNADMEGCLAATCKIGTTFPVFLLSDNGTIFNKSFYVTTQLSNALTKGAGTGLSPIIYGIWSQLFLAYWSGVDILVDPYTGSTSGNVRIVALQDMDIQVRHNEAFAMSTDVITTGP